MMAANSTESGRHWQEPCNLSSVVVAGSSVVVEVSPHAVEAA